MIFIGLESEEIEAGRQADWEYEEGRRSSTMAAILWLTTGIFGGHRFYIGNPLIGVLMLATLGGLGLWALIDVFFWPRSLRAANAELRQAIFDRRGVPIP